MSVIGFPIQNNPVGRNSDGILGVASGKFLRVFKNYLPETYLKSQIAFVSNERQKDDGDNPMVERKIINNY
jgi:hypothetical protein